MRSQSSSAFRLQRSILIGAGLFVAICETVRLLSVLSSSSASASASINAAAILVDGTTNVADPSIGMNDNVAAFLSTNKQQRQQQRQPPSYQLALKESFGFFDDVSDENWMYRQSLARNRQDHALPLSESLHETRPAFWYIAHYYPSFTCPTSLWRIGGPGDGPKYVCDAHRLKQQARSCLVYSVGSKAKFEFEDGLIQLIGTACEIHVFDPRPLPAGMAEELRTTKNIHFHHWGFTSSYDAAFNPRKHGIKKGNFKTLQQTVAELGHAQRPIDIFKIDCEGCEWATYKDWLDVDIRQLLVETHDLPSPKANVSLDFFDDLIDAGFNVMSREPNIYPFVTKHNNMALEWSFIRLDPAFSGGRTNRTIAD